MSTQYITNLSHSPSFPSSQGDYEAALQIYDSQVGLCLDFASKRWWHVGLSYLYIPECYQYTRDED